VKWLERFFVCVSVIIAAIMIVSGVYLFFRTQKMIVAPSSEIVKEFEFSSDQSLNEWDEKTLGVKKTKYSVVNVDGKDSVKAVSNNSASALFYRQKLSFARNPFLSWDWKAGNFPLRKHEEVLDEKEEFDFVAQVYIIFHSRFFLKMKAIQYVWSEKLPVGTVSNSPYTKNVKLLVLETGASDEWKHEMRDLRKDFAELFGEELQKDVEAVSFMTDSDSTDTTATAYYSNFKLGYLEMPSDAMDIGQEKEAVD